MKFVSFASSSKGNAALVSYKGTNVLIDCGISKKRIIECLSKYNLTLNDIDCILLTHSHTDHISGLPMVLKERDVKVLGLRETLVSVSEIAKKSSINLNYDSFKIVKPVNIQNSDSYIKVKDICIYPLKGCHDVPSLYYKLKLGDTNVAIVTDIGQFNDNLIRNIFDVDYLMLECNYDTEMLMYSSRPESLKSRVSGPYGHLSNIECCEILKSLISSRLKSVFLSHISEETNSEEYALEFTRNYFKSCGDDYFIPKINVAKRLDITEILND